ncbi:STAS/SEC14 domain-containing protein [Nitratireductor sp. ZSWI3]|uniref:STAS/SEC14 domain-containing protein n=1 Tax=Nitratireductor sp. ZSWI3 TaxID=2966359 RepID=UPI00214FDF80|nr:STAS/SEC14 domain-containing protein [Nitratireductor sp. ZSWI3]MCR4267142.1 STAS/SEC14 domain-containing protein [Nitratireductor sp. ZSWI3]
MTINDDPPHVRRVETDREDAYAFEIVGRISAADMENLYGLLEGAYEVHDKIDVIVVLRDYEGFDWQAAFKEQTMIGKTHALRHIRRYALVGGPAWMGTMVGLFRPFFSMQIRHFDADRIGEAWAWLDARPAEPSI